MVIRKAHNLETPVRIRPPQPRKKKNQILIGIWFFF